MRREALRLYLVADRGYAAGRRLRPIVEAAVRAGVTLVQIRDKGNDARAFLAEALELRAALAGSGVPLLVNDRIDIARAIGAEGVHLGQRDLPPRIAREQLGPDAIIGLSIENRGQLGDGKFDGVDYLGVGPVFATGTKSDASAPIGLDGLAAIRAATRLPMVGIGGIGPADAAAVRATGVNGICVVSAILGATNPAAAARALL
ncbi:MAG: thiamine phosphate synthase [Alphaproteobacteria bacterium]|nr:thiamine phosphate synthase [Alphaproteobacteria bacterium]MCW5742874.1 thiamine phosphate synthase [Alphaproteobacteria bacterium]